MCYNVVTKNKNMFTKKYSYNTISFVVFITLLLGTFSFFTFADDSNLTLFEDFDRDGLSNTEEEALGTNPKVADTDGDGYTDGVEVESGYNPLIPAPGDRIIKDRAPVKIKPIQSDTTNVTRKISEDLVSYLADAQENGVEEINTEEFSKIVSEAVDKEVTFNNIDPIDPNSVRIKKQDYSKLSKKEREEKLREDAIEYFTAISYIFVSTYPQNFFNRPVDEFENEMMQQLANFSTSINNYGFFEDLAKNAVKAESQMQEVEVPADLIELHMKGLYLLRYIKSIYEAGDYKNATSDITPMIAALAKIQGILDLSIEFQKEVKTTMQNYGIEKLFLEF